jgi:glycosyltransferase involved in cell wall biosynthesis
MTSTPSSSSPSSDRSASVASSGASSSTENPLLTLFVACYNEEENIEATLDTVAAACMELGITYEMIVIDDGSRDRSVELVRAYIERYPERNVRLVVNAENQGLGVNYVEAAFLGRGEWYRLICGDNVEPKETFVKVFSHIGKADLIIPYQTACPGRPMSRVLLSRAYTFLVNCISGYNIRYYNGLCLTRRQLVMRWHPSSHGFGIQADLVTRLLSRGVSYLEVPVEARERATGTSKAITLRNFCSVAHSLLNIAIRRISKIVYGRC